MRDLPTSRPFTASSKTVIEQPLCFAGSWYHGGCTIKRTFKENEIFLYKNLSFLDNHAPRLCHTPVGHLLSLDNKQISILFILYSILYTLYSLFCRTFVHHSFVQRSLCVRCAFASGISPCSSHLIFSEIPCKIRNVESQSVAHVMYYFWPKPRVNRLWGRRFTSFRGSAP